jgi:hypothetical protein
MYKTVVVNVTELEPMEKFSIRATEEEGEAHSQIPKDPFDVGRKIFRLLVFTNYISDVIPHKFRTLWDKCNFLGCDPGLWRAYLPFAGGLYDP